VAHNAKLGNIYASELTLDAENVKLNMKKLMDGKSNCVDSADSIEMHGIITENDLRDFIARSVDKVDNVTVEIDPDVITATGSIKLAGRDVDINLKGLVVPENGDLYFRPTNVTVKNMKFLSNLSVDNFIDDIEIVDHEILILGTHFTEVKLLDGSAKITAVR